MAEQRYEYRVMVHHPAYDDDLVWYDDLQTEGQARDAVTRMTAHPPVYSNGKASFYVERRPIMEWERI